MSDSIGARGIYFHAPIMLPDRRTRDALFANAIDASLRDYWRQCSIALLTANPIRTGSMLANAGFLDESEIRELRACGAVGSLLGRFYDVDGQFVDHHINQRIAAVPLEDLANIPNVIAVSRHKRREASLLGALRTGLINTVVTDVDAARRVCEKAGR
jgi:DNA-binding transcriptional regulator LsrR (DeoR family)